MHNTNPDSNSLMMSIPSQKNDQAKGLFSKSHFPYDDRGPKISNYCINIHKFQIDQDLFERLNQISNGIDHTLHMILLTGVSILLNKYTDSEEPIVGMPVYAQTGGTERSRVVPISNKLIAGSSFKSGLIYIRQTMMELLGKEGSSGDTQSNTNLTDAFPSDILVLLESIHQKDHIEDVQPNIKFVFKKLDHFIEGYVEFNSFLYRKSTIDLLCNNLNELLKETLFHVDRPLSEIDLKRTSIPKTFDCYIIGDSTLPIRCAEFILENGNEIFGIISDDKEVRKWCANNNILNIDYDKDLAYDFISQASYDYLFSINNPYFLPNKIVASPKKYAINYHDALLPKYAGRFATSWAIINDEKEHGITWHLLDDSYDTGAIVKQEHIDVVENETVFSLNIKCYEAASKSFEEVVALISSKDPVELSPQSLADRTYYGFEERCNISEVISWNDTAEYSYSLVRAASFENYENPFIVPKIVLGHHFYIVAEARIANRKSDAAPGKILAVNADELHIATASNDFVITRLKTIDGIDVTISSVTDQLQLTQGSTVFELPREVAQEVCKINAQIYKYERFWVNRIQQTQPLILPYTSLSVLNTTKSKRETIRQKITIEDINGSSSVRCAEMVLSTFLAYLTRLTNSNSFSIGFKDHTIHHFEGIYASLFANMVPLQVEVNEDCVFDDFLAAAISELERLKKNKTYPLDLLARYPQISKKSEDILNANSLSVSIVPSLGEIALNDNSQDEKLQLQLIIAEDSDEVTWLYNRSLISPELVSGMVNQFAIFIQNAFKNSDAKVLEVEILDQDEVKRILYDFNATETAYSSDKTLSLLFEEQVLKTPDGIAAIFENSNLTYAQLNKKANQLARELMAQGLQKGEYVGICADRSLEMIIGVMGILKAGGTYIPLETYLPEKRLAFILDSLQVKYVLTTALQLDKINTLETEVLSLEVIVCLNHYSQRQTFQKATHIKEVIWHEDLLEKADHNIELTLSSESIAYVIFTSGSTGTPKGVIVKHRPVINTIEWVNRTHGVNANDKLLFVTSLSFDLSVYDIFGILSSGGSIYILPSEKLREPEQVVDILVNENITFWDSAPEVLQQLTPYFDKVKEVKTSLRLVFLSGDWIPVSLPDALKNTFEGVKVISLGGATEATIWSNYYPIETVDPSWRSIPYGKPIQNARYYILDAKHHPCPIGIEGDLYIGGKCLAEGYINDEKLTADKFIDSPFVKDEKIYKTGDLARWFADGNMEFLGRKDSQVKIRGFRVELGEIESVLSKHEHMKEVVVMVKDMGNSDKRLMAYFTASTTISVTSLRKYLKELLPDYMVPGNFIQIDHFPLTSVGKLDRKALLNIKETSDDQSLLPTTPFQLQVAQIWKEHLNTERITLSDNFFDLGGHSLLVIKVRFKMKEIFGEEPAFINFMNMSFSQFVSDFEKKLAAKIS